MSVLGVTTIRDQVAREIAHRLNIGWGTSVSGRILKREERKKWQLSEVTNSLSNGFSFYALLISVYSSLRTGAVGDGTAGGCWNHTVPSFSSSLVWGAPLLIGWGAILVGVSGFLLFPSPSFVRGGVPAHLGKFPSLCYG